MNAYYADRWRKLTRKSMEFLMEETGSIQETLEHHDFYIIDAKVDEIGRALGLADIGMDRDVTELSRRTENQGSDGKAASGKTGYSSSG